MEDAARIARLVATLLVMGVGKQVAAAQDPAATGQSIALDDLLVITATLHEQSVMDAPAAIIVVTAADIAARGYRSLPEILADLAGFSEVSDINEETIATRGVFASTTNKTLFLINGHRMNDVLLGRYNVDQYLGIEAIERIELIRGPASPLYGTGAFVGVVNIITKKGREVAGTRIKYQGGTLGHEGSLTWGRLVGDYDLLFNVTFRDQHGEEIEQSADRDVVPPGEPAQGKRPGHVHWRSYPENWSGILDVRTENACFTVRGAHFSRVTPRGATGSFYDYQAEPIPPTYTVNDVFLDFRRSFTFGASGANRLTVNPALHYFSYAEHSFITFGADRQPPFGTRSGTVSDMNNYQLKLTYDRSFLGSLSGTLGFDGLVSHMYRNDRLSVARADAQLIPAGYTPPGRWFLAGLFAQVVYLATSQITITAGGRFDTFDGAAAARFTPRVGVVWRPREDLALKLLYGEAYLAPEWAHRRSREPQFLGNPALEPETFRGGDIIAIYQGKALGLTADLYANEVAALINSVPNASGGGSYQNTGTSVYLGLDATAEVELIRGLRMNAGYSYIRSTKRAVGAPGARPLVAGDEILDIPHHTLRYGLRLGPIRNATLSLWGRFTGPSKTLDPILHPSPPPASPAAAFVGQRPVFLIDASGGYTWGPLSLQVIATNLTNTYYERGGTVPRPLPRNRFVLEVGAAWRF